MVAICVKRSFFRDMRDRLTPLHRAVQETGRGGFESETVVGELEALRLGEAIKEARRSRSPRMTQEGLAEQFGVARQTVANWERGKHTPDLATLKALERLFELRPGALTAGLRSRVIIAGYVAAGDHGAEAVFDPQPLPIDDALLPFASDASMAWLQVRGSSMLPIYRDGDLIAYDADTAFEPENCLRRLCVVQTGDQRVMVKTILPGTRHGRYDLMSTNAEPIEDEVIAWASPVKAAFYR
ncbi:MAG: helix-turn-helix domain-containing protein [Pseudomonadota bacterium]